MDELKQLILKCGMSQEFASELCESLDAHEKQLRSGLNEEFKAKLEDAKKRLVEETEQYKMELARRVQVFLESKSAAVEEQLTKQSAIKESAATSQLEKVKAILEGIELNGSAPTELLAKNAKLERRVKQLTESCNHATRKANRLQKLSERIVANSRSGQRPQLVQESKTTPVAAKPFGAQRQTSAKPQTARPVLNEGRTRRVSIPQASSDPIAQIAQSCD